VNTEKSLGTVLTETKEEIKEFIETRVQLLRTEIVEKLRIWKYSVPLLLVAGALLLAAWMTLTFALVAVIHTWFLPGPYAWFFAALIVTAIYLIAGAVVGWFAYTELVATGLTPKRTLEVLKQDQVWIQNETRAA
jgi:hypothetical protein